MSFRIEVPEIFIYNWVYKLVFRLKVTASVIRYSINYLISCWSSQKLKKSGRSWTSSRIFYFSSSTLTSCQVYDFFLAASIFFSSWYLIVFFASKISSFGLACSVTSYSPNFLILSYSFFSFCSISRVYFIRSNNSLRSSLQSFNYAIFSGSLSLRIVCSTASSPTIRATCTYSLFGSLYFSSGGNSVT